MCLYIYIYISFLGVLPCVGGFSSTITSTACRKAGALQPGGGGTQTAMEAEQAEQMAIVASLKYEAQLYAEQMALEVSLKYEAELKAVQAMEGFAEP